MEESNVEELTKYMIEEFDFKDFIYDDKNIQLSFHLIPKYINERGKKGLAVIVSDLSKIWKDDNNGIINSLIKKSSRYGKINKPYIIFVNTFTGNFFNTNNILDAIWGTTCQYENEIFRLNEGFFGSMKNKKHTRVSGIMINNVMDANLQNANYVFCKHPYSINNFDFNIIGLDYYNLIEKNVIKITS